MSVDKITTPATSAPVAPVAPVVGAAPPRSLVTAEQVWRSVASPAAPAPPAKPAPVATPAPVAPVVGAAPPPSLVSVRRPGSVKQGPVDPRRVPCTTCGAAQSFACGGHPALPKGEEYHPSRVADARRALELVRVAPPAPLKQDLTAVPKNIPLAVLQQAEARKVRLRDIAYNEAANVRGVDVIRLALARPDLSLGTAAAVELEHELLDLLESIPSMGLLEPPLCAIEPNGSLTLVAGYRRYAALTFLYGVDCEITAYAARMDAAQRLAANLAENSGRKGVVVWRCIERCWVLRETHKWEVPAIAKSVGYSVSHTENLLRVKRKLAPAIWRAWAQYGVEVPLERILKLLPHTHEEQLTHWNKMMGQRPPAEEGEEEGEEDEKPTKSKAKQEAPLTVSETRTLLVRVQSEVPGLRTPEQRFFLNGAEAALRTVLGYGAWETPNKRTVNAPRRAAVPAKPPPPPKKTVTKKTVTKKTVTKKQAPAKKAAAKKR